MENRWSVAVSAGLLAVVWAGVADVFNWITWLGFMGCSTFFAQHLSGIKGMFMAWATNLSGVLWGWLIISASSFFVSPMVGYIMTGLVTAAMCLQASYYRLAFIPGTFIGCCVCFALAGDLVAIIPPLLIGGTLGLAMSLLTGQFVSLSNKLSKAQVAE
ncbi:DUF1097 domain-containing protein [Shewanella surugensis]|uniref:DUF1097 domain-containing protein n=1 Tax=Shewanella surugensis TaxID=212020 RepID=A0ABT0LCK4_9GAMM|nr:DUF1097 domain-containing protein [Shewanella surugensis]MCL1125289.1 DUF1097 domain-containing protein [Shewanella surugensis]